MVLLVASLLLVLLLPALLPLLPLVALVFLGWSGPTDPSGDQRRGFLIFPRQERSSEPRALASGADRSLTVAAPSFFLAGGISTEARWGDWRVATPAARLGRSQRGP
jgi:hypothetical protein